MFNIQAKLDTLRRSARRAVILRGVSWVVVFGCCAVFLAGFADWYWHVDQNLRVALGLGIAVGCGWLLWRTLIRPLTRSLTDVDLAIKIERRFPGFRDSLASAVQFQQEHADPRLGSPALQQRVIAETIPQLESVEIDAVMEKRSVRAAASSAFAVSVFVLLVVSLNQTEAGMAVRRLFFPYSAGEWMRETQLQLLDEKLKPIPADANEPIRRVAGDTFRVYVENTKGDLPEDTAIEVKDADSKVLPERLRRLVVRGQNGTVHRLGTASLLMERGPIHFRAVGGDDQHMRWRRIDVVPAPRIESIRVTLTPPGYTQQQPETLPDGVGHIQALVGTRVDVLAKVNTPLQSAGLRVKSDTPQVAKLASDGRSFRISFLLKDPGNYSYAFDIKDRQGFDNPNAPRYEIRARRDRVPTVRLIRPAKNIRATANAVVPIRVVAEDDIGIRDVRLRYRSSATPDGPYKTVELITPAKLYRWQLKDLLEGMQIRLYAEATDHFRAEIDPAKPAAAKSKHIGRSLTRLLTIVSTEEKTAELTRDYGLLLDELARIAKQQQQAHDTVSQLLLQLQKARKLRPKHDLPLLRRAERNQREINIRLSETGGIEVRANELIEEMRNNRITRDDLKRRLTWIAAELAELRKHHLRKIEAGLTIVRKNTDTALFAARGAKDTPTAKMSPQQQTNRLQDVLFGQEIVLNSLRELIEELREWRNQQELSNDLADLIKEQESVQRKSVILKSQTFGLKPSELKSQKKADLARLAELQQRLGDRVDRFEKDIRKFLDSLEKRGRPNPSAAAILREAADFLRDRRTSSRMRDSRESITSNRLGLATAEQQAFLKELREVEAILDNRGASDLETLIKQQKAAELDLLNLKNEQETLQKKTAATAKTAARRRQETEAKRLIRQQQSLKKKLDQMGSRLRRLLALRANNATRRASDGMRRAVDALQRQELPHTLEEQQKVLQHLEQARRELANTRRQAEEQLAREMLERIAGELRGVIIREQNVIDETLRLKEKVQRTGRWSRGTLMTLDGLQDEQLSLRAKVQDVAKKTQSAEVVAEVLNSIARQMQRAVDHLATARKKTESLPLAIEDERRVKERLVKLLADLAPAKQQASTEPLKSPNAKTPPPGNQELIRQLAQWKLLRTSQQDVRRQTAKLHERRKPMSPDSPMLKESIEELADEQAKLADLAQNLSPKKAIQKTQPKEATKLTSADLQRQIIQGMRAAGQMLARNVTGETTQQVQQRIITALNELIRRGEEQQAQTGSSSPSRKTDTKKRPKSKTPMGTGNGMGTAKEDPTGSDAHIRNAQKTNAANARAQRRALNRKFWGDLPEAERQRLGNVAGGKSLPIYKPLNDRYFQSLAEEK